MTIDPERPLWSAREVAAALNVHVNTVKRWAEAGYLSGGLRIGPRGDWRFDSVEIERYLGRK